MLKNFFGKKNDKGGTGVYILEKSNLIELEEIPGNGSVNSVIESIGFAINQVHTVHTFDSNKIEVIGFKIFSEEALFVLAKKDRVISILDISKQIKEIDWRFEYSSLNVEDILDEGIKAQNLSLDFLSSVLDLKKDGVNLFKSEKFGLYLQFEEIFLQAFTSSGWEDSASKWLRELNEKMYVSMLKEAEKYHYNDIDSMEEVNNQARSLLNIPQAMNNKFIPLHTKQNGNINFYNLLVAHYTENCTLEEFIFMNKGRCKKIKTSSYEVGNYIYEFNDLSRLDKVYTK